MPHTADRGLHTLFLDAAKRFPERTAVEVGGEAVTYAQLRSRAAALAATLAAAGGHDRPPLTAVLAQRSPTAFTGVLGALLRGHAYLPLNPAYPIERTRQMLLRSGCREVVVDGGATALVEPLLAGVDAPLLVVLPDVGDVCDLRRRWPAHTVLGADDLRPASHWEQPPTDPDDLAYLLFTSGTTGVPKGVMVSHRNVVPVVEHLADRYGVSEADRLSQTFDLTFDPSVFDMFVGWSRGACVCCPSAKARMAPAQFLREARLTVWFSVPSTAVLMRRLGMLKPGSYPGLRWSLFCGEALTADLAEAWADAAPNSVVENLYGPTEVTIVCTGYRWDPVRSPAECELGLVPIGTPFPGMEALVVDDSLREVPAGADGELLMAGPQVTEGYWADPSRTAAAFVVPPGRTAVHYRTGDRVRRHRPDGVLHYLGRLDHQVKVQGHRIELGDVEAALRDAAGTDGVVALGWPRTATGVAGIAAFLEKPEVALDELRDRVKMRLPDYMVPRRFEYLERLPVNAHGKFDRDALVRLLEEPA